MANLIYGSKRKFLNTSRYVPYKTIINIDTGVTYLESYNQFMQKRNLSEVYHVVEPTEEGRLDMISNLYYGSPRFYWLIAEANKIIDPFTVISGTILLIPKLESIYEKGGVLSKI